MQLPGDAVLAAALVAPKRYLGVRLLFDWDRNGLFVNANSDLSNLVEEISVDRQLTGDYPDELEVTEGYAAAVLTVTLGGVLADGTPIWKAFSPYGGNPLGMATANNVPMYYEITVRTASEDHVWSIRQFTGRLRLAVPDRADGTVSISCLDAAYDLANPATLPVWAQDYWTATQFPGTPDAADSGKTLISWVLDFVLRKGGFYQGPKPLQSTVVGWTLNGSGLPDVGSISLEEWRIRSPLGFTAGYGAWNIPQYVPAGPPSTVWSAGPYGLAFVGLSALPATSPARKVLGVEGNAHSTVACQVNIYGTPNGNRMVVAGWVKLGAGLSPSATPSTITMHLEDARYDHGFTPNQFTPAYLQTSFDHTARTVSALVKANGWTTTWNWGPSAAQPTGWSFIYMSFTFTASSVTAACVNQTTATTILSGNGGTAAAIGSLPYNWQGNASNLCQVISYGPMQHVSISYQPGGVALTIPNSAPPAQQAAVDLTALRLNWMPNLANVSAWDILRGGASADMGALYVTEQGKPVYDSRSTVAGRRVSGASVRTVTLDDVMDLSPQSTFDGLRNYISYSIRTRLAYLWSDIYSSTRSDQYQAINGTPLTYVIPLTDVQSIRIGNLTYRPEAQGYGNPSGASDESGHTGPYSPYTWQDWMRIYGPAFWYDGFTSYVAGSALPEVQPTASPGLTCAALVGAVVGDQDSRTLRLVLTNGSASFPLQEFAVNDETPFLHVGGTKVQDVSSYTAQPVIDAASVAAYGARVLEIPTSDWQSDDAGMAVLAASLLADTKDPHPYFQVIDVVGDPRLQLQDVITISDPNGMGGPMYGSLVGITRTINVSGGGGKLTDSYTIRSFS